MDSYLASMPIEQPRMPSAASSSRGATAAATAAAAPAAAPAAATATAAADLTESFSALSTMQPQETTVIQKSVRTLASGPATPANSRPLVIIGGWLNTDWEQSDACWCEETSGWEQFTNLPVKLISCAVSAIPGGLFLAGGLDTNKYVTNICYIYSCHSNKWQQRRDMPTDRCEAAAVTVGDCVIVMGGWRGGDEVLDVCERFDIPKNEWTGMKAMLQGMACPIVTRIQEKIYVVFHDDNISKINKKGDEISLQICNTITEEWTFGPPLPAHFGSTDGASAVTVNDTMLVAGGMGRMFAQYVPSTRVWVKLTPPHLLHSCGAAVVSGGRVILAGGACGVVSDTIEEYDIVTDKWVIRKDKMPVGLWCHHMILLDK